jgi:Fe-S oxidoreductase
MTPALARLLQTVSDACIRCNLCQPQCTFLQRYGKPGEIAARYEPHRATCQRLPFECHLCGLCTAVCPVTLDPAALFLAMRQESEQRGMPAYDANCVYLGYESRGISRHLSHYALPAGCDTVLFPGCTLPATRPAATWELFAHLRRRIPRLGFVLDCCTKASHDLGRQPFFDWAFGELHAFLVDHGVRTVLVCCPNCHRIFEQYGGGLEVKTVYELLADSGMTARVAPGAAVCIHDPCVLRFRPDIQQAVRVLLRRSAIAITELPHHGRQTICCGLGASVGCVTPELANRWLRVRREEAAGRPLVTYCAGCAERLRGPGQPAAHVLDLFFPAGAVQASRQSTPRFPWTCLNRARLKRRIQREVPAAVSDARPWRPPQLGGGVWNPNRAAYWVSYALVALLGRWR